MVMRHLTTAALLALLALPATGVAQPRPDPAQRPEPAPTTTPPEKIAPPEKIPGDARESSGGSGTEALGDRLSRTDGVIKPPSDVDPGMTTPAPDPGPRSMPVIPPPGTHHADPVKPR
jgi:hypothetical protein